MLVVRNAQELPRHPRGWCVALGMFDGVHLGHQHVIRSALLDAASHGAASAAITFDPHPLSVLRPDRAPLLLQPLSARLKAMESMGVDAALVIEFNETFSRLTGEAFIEQLAHDAGRIRSISVGSGFQFGHARSGDVPVLRTLGERLGFEVNTCAAVSIGESRVSSSRVRQSLRAGRLKEVAELLGRPYSVWGTVRPGDQLGRRIGVPTANLDVRGLELPPHGVYAVRVTRGSEIHPGVLNIGVRPTVAAAGELRFEVHLLDFDGDLLGSSLEVRFVARLRDERRFPDLDALISQIRADISAARALLR